MHPELEAIVDADRTARRDVENARIIAIMILGYIKSEASWASA
jgi:hypothetical protein